MSINEIEEFIYDGDDEEDTLNEDWIKPFHWDLYRDETLVTTLIDLFFINDLTYVEISDQIAFLQNLITLPAYEAVPDELEKEINSFLDANAGIMAADVRARAQTLHNNKIGHREPSEVEAAAKTNFDTIQQEWENQTEALVSQWTTIRNQQIDELSNQIQEAVDASDVDAIASILADTTGEDLIAQHMTQMMEKAVTTARTEAQSQGVVIPLLNTSDLATRMSNQASAVATIMNRSLSNTAATQALMRYGTQSLSGTDVASAVAEHLQDLSPTYLNDMLGGALTQAQNAGRIFTMQQAPGTFYSSELLDEATCDNCEAVDGTEYGTLGDAEQDYPTGGYSECLGGPRCRGTIIAVYDEANSSDSTIS